MGNPVTKIRSCSLILETGFVNSGFDLAQFESIGILLRSVYAVWQVGREKSTWKVLQESATFANFGHLAAAAVPLQSCLHGMLTQKSREKSRVVRKIAIVEMSLKFSEVWNPWTSAWSAAKGVLLKSAVKKSSSGPVLNKNFIPVLKTGQTTLEKFC